MVNPTILLENTRNWPEEIQREIDQIAALDGDASSISMDDLFTASTEFCNTSASETLTGKIICEGKDNWTVGAVWNAAAKLEALKDRKLSAKNDVHWHLDKEAKIVGEDKKKQAYEILQDIKQIYLEHLGEKTNISDKDKLILVYLVLQDIGFVFENHGNEPLFTNDLINKKLDCDTSSFVVRALAEEFGWPVHLVVIPEHVFVRWNDGKVAFNIDGGKILPDAYYRKNFGVRGNVSRYQTPYKAMVYANLSIAKDKKKDFDGAINDINEALKIFPNCVTFWFGRGIIKLHKRDLDGGIDDINKALKIYPGYVEGWKVLGDLMLKKGDLDGYIYTEKKILEIDPNNYESWTGIGATLFRKGDLDGSERAYERAEKIDREHNQGFRDFIKANFKSEPR